MARAVRARPILIVLRVDSGCDGCQGDAKDASRARTSCETVRLRPTVSTIPCLCCTHHFVFTLYRSAVPHTGCQESYHGHVISEFLAHIRRRGPKELIALN
jgi:hypothetical protein